MISVIIPAYNEADTIGPCLEAFARQRTTEPFEVILVDNGSTDDTVKVAKTFHSKMNLRIIREPRKGRGQARRTGWAAARGSVLLSTDADATVPQDWIQTYTELFVGHPEILVFTGNSVIRDFGFLKNGIVNMLQFAMAFTIRGWAGYYCCNGFNFGVRAWAYRAVGGFDPTLDAQEDMELGKRIQKIGKAGFTTRTCLPMSGRRFKQGIIKGGLNYPVTYIQKFWFKKKWVPLDDVR